MGREIHRLSARKVQTLAEPGRHADAGTAGHFGKVVGISVNAALAGAPVRYVSAGLNRPGFPGGSNS